MSSDTQLQYALEAGDVYKPLAALAFSKREIDINTEERQVGKAIFLEWLYEGRDFTAKAPWLTDAQREQILTYDPKLRLCQQ